MTHPNLELRPPIMRTLGLVAALCAGVGLGACSKTNQDITPPDTAGPTACTEEAMECPDGSSVGRAGPECEFEACPEPAAADDGAPEPDEPATDEPEADETADAPEGAAG